MKIHSELEGLFGNTEDEFCEVGNALPSQLSQSYLVTVRAGTASCSPQGPLYSNMGAFDAMRPRGCGWCVRPQSLIHLLVSGALGLFRGLLEVLVRALSFLCQPVLAQFVPSSDTLSKTHPGALAEQRKASCGNGHLCDGLWKTSVVTHHP